MPRTRRWMLALLVLACVVAAPMHAPSYGFADDIRDLRSADTESPVPVSDDHDDDADEWTWDGFQYPGDDRIQVGFFSLFRSAGYLPDPDEYRGRDGVGFNVGGGEPEDYSFLSSDGSRVFPLAKGTFRVSQEFGCVPLDPGYALADFCPSDRPSFHHGVDLAADEGTTIYAAATGTVNFSDIDTSNESGNSIVRIIHDGANSGYVTEYFHWNVSYVDAGDYVIAGQPIGEVGSVGYSSGPHLHFGVFDSGSGEYIEPLEWLRGSESLPVAAGVGGVGGNDGVMQWTPLIRAAADRYDIPAALIAAIITVESGGNPEAVSPVGAQGLMQVMPMHLERYGIPARKWRDPETNIGAGTRLLAELLKSNGTLTNAVGAYFGHGCDVLGTCTEDYIAAVFTWFSYYVPIFGDVAVDAGQYDPPPSAARSEPGSNAANATPTPETEPTRQAMSTPTATPSPEPSPTATREPSSTPTATPSPEPSPSPTREPDRTPTPTPTAPRDTDDSDQGQEQPADDEQPQDDQEQPEPTPEPTPEPEPEPTPVEDDESDDEELPILDPTVAEGFDSRWNVDREAGVITRSNKDNDDLIAVIEVGSKPYALAIGENAVWVIDRSENKVFRIDPETNEVTESFDVKDDPVGISVTEKGIWIAHAGEYILVLFDAGTGDVLKSIDLDKEPCGLQFTDGLLVVNACDQDELIKIDPAELEL